MQKSETFTNQVLNLFMNILMHWKGLDLLIGSN